jgi:microcystin-dependent protein
MPLIDVTTVRVPELTEFTGALKNLDQLIVWIAETDETLKIPLSKFRAFVMDGLTSSVPPVYVGGSFVHEITAAEAGGQIALIPSLAGMSFNLRRQGQGIVPINQWEVLDAGGFKLTTAGDFLVEGEIFELDVVEYQNNNTGTGGFALAGVRPVPTNFTLLPEQVGHAVQLRAGASIVTLTLPNIVDIPVHSIVPIEATFNNTKQAKIQTVGGQKIYMNGEERTFIYIGAGESAWLYNDATAWYVFSAKGNWDEVGQVVQGYIPGKNQIVCQGQLVNRADYPRLWEAVQQMGSSSVSDTQWATTFVLVDGYIVNKPFKGCFSSGNGTTTFRLPDLSQSVLKGLKIGSSSADQARHLNFAGIFQAGRVGPHRHFSYRDVGSTYNNAALTAGNFPQDEAGAGAGVGNNNMEYSIRGQGSEPNVGLTSTEGTSTYGNQVDNIGINFYIKY